MSEILYPNSSRTTVTCNSRMKRCASVIGRLPTKFFSCLVEEIQIISKRLAAVHRNSWNHFWGKKISICIKFNTAGVVAACLIGHHNITQNQGIDLDK